MSPEQANAIPVVSQSDLYSLGVVAYHCLTGQPPFSGSPTALIDAHKNSKPRAFADAAPDIEIDQKLEKLVMRMLAKQPGERPPSAKEVYEELRTLIVPNEVVSVPKPPKGEDVKPPSPWPTWVAAGVATFAVAVAVYILLSPPPDDGAVQADNRTTDNRPAVAAATEGKVKFDLQPPDARVTVGDQLIADPLVYTERRPGKYVAEVSAKGYIAKRPSFEVRAGEEHTVQVVLEIEPPPPPPPPDKPRVRVTNYSSTRIVGNDANRKADRAVKRAAVACYRTAHPSGTEKVEFIVVVDGAYPPTVNSDATAFAECMGKKLSDVRYSVKGDGLIEAAVQRKAGSR